MSQLSDQEAIDVLNTWIAFEVLTPQTFSGPVQHAGGNESFVTDVNKTYFLPWENGGEKAKQDTRIHYHLYLGTIDIVGATALLVEKYDNSVFESPPVTGESVITVLTLDQQGRPLELHLSSYAWGVNQALNKELSELSEWMRLEETFIKLFRDNVYQYDDSKNLLPFNKLDIDNAYQYLNEILNIPESLSSKKLYVIKKIDQYSKKNPPPQSPLINSFYLEDLNHAKNLIKQGFAPESLKKYLGMKLPDKRINILEDNNALENILAPKNVPLSRWPGKGRHSLVLLQQAAVNTAHTELKKEGILAVNGPPGTGKTTLLRDIIASIITDRAIALAKFDDPLTAFTTTNYKIKAGKGWIELHKIDESLKGFEILIASSNNKAVENISAELPSLSAIADDAANLRYFNDLADQLFNGKNWGIISAILGNSSNRNRFNQTFWWDKDYNLSTYLAHAAGYPQSIDIIDKKTKEVIETRPPHIVVNNNAPNNRNEALKRWQIARVEFLNVLNESQNKITQLENFRQDILILDSLATELGLDEQTLIDLILKHQYNKPNIFLRIFKTARAVEWKNKQDRICIYNDLNKKLEIFVEKYKDFIINKSFFQKTHSIKNQISPWCDAQTQNVRDNLFIQTMKLQKAFMDAAAKPMRHNIGIFMNILSKQAVFFDKPVTGQTKETIMELLPHVWASFFIAVPSVSTTFASAGKMLDHLAPGALGWLLIDEAGQAIPQAAVGAITRVKRVVVTGDPLQIEPVVTLPSILTENICCEFNVDADRFNAPKASVQTLADIASSYYAEFCTKQGSRTVGFPLLVHRRCSDPMFNISNIIAYERLMVQAKKAKDSKIRECLGESSWFDIKGTAEEKWCPQEGEKIIEILTNLRKNNIFPDLYIITPFKIIATNLQKMIENNGVMQGWFDINSKNWLKEHVGTVHTFQGREADTVILILGASSIEQSGARNWAGKEPNILNVAVTRAKENLYIVGNRDLWKNAGVFSELAERLLHK